MFGGQLDVHSGGIDLAFPHHENEIAQSEAYHQCGQWANYFLHSGKSQTCLVPRARSLESRRCLKVFGGHSCCRAEFGSSCVSCSVQRVVAVFRALTPEGQSRENV